MARRMMAWALALSGAAYAQVPTETMPAAQAETDHVGYDAAFFAQFNAQNALDMVRQTPGFSLDEGDDRRGFSGAVGNVLIDGQRPNVKSQSLSDILSRIPADQVVRIELLRGAAVAGDASGQAVLANIVRTPTAIGGVWEAGFERTSRDVAAPRGELSFSGRNAGVEYGLGASIFSQYRDLPGARRFYDEPGAVYAGRAETHSPRDSRDAAVNGNLAFPLLGGRLSTTGEVTWFRYHSDNGFFFFDAADAPDSTLTQVYEEQEGGFEFGATYERELGTWSFELIALVNRARFESDEDGRNQDFVGADDFTYTQAIRQDTGESILRGVLSRPLGTRHHLEFGGEGAFNSLDQRLAFLRDTGGGPVVVPIGNANVLVEEERAEFFAVETWRPADDWSIETRLAWETSTLTFTGDDNQTVDLAFWKPSLQITRSFGDNNQIRLRYYRDVGQLDFGDFVSASAVADAMISGGNTDLQPQTDWRAELGLDLRFGDDAALSLTLTHHDISDVSDVVYLPLLGFDAPGNLGDAEAWSLDINLSAPVPFVPGGRLTVEANFWDSEVIDPLTNQPRIISSHAESEVDVDFRQDFASLRSAWGVSAHWPGETQAYRFNEIDTFEEGPWIDIFVETTALPYHTKLRVWAANVFDGTVNRERHFYDQEIAGVPQGRNGALTSRNMQSRAFPDSPWLIVEFSGTF